MLIKANSSTAPATRPLLGTALLALVLAGCGGGSDGGGTSDAGASDAGAITPKTVANGAHQDTSSASGAADSGHAAAGADGQNAAQNGGNAAPADGSAGAAAQPASGATPITEAGISTELFAQILSTQTAYVKLGQRDIPIMYGYRAAELESTNDGQRPPTLDKWKESGAADFVSYQQPVDGKFVVESWGLDRNRDKEKPEGEHVSARAFFGYAFPKAGDAAGGRVTLTSEAELKYGYQQAQGGGTEYRETLPMKADADKVIPRDGVIAFNEPVQTWRDAGGPLPQMTFGGLLELRIEKGDAADEVLFCLEQRSRSLPQSVDTSGNPGGPTRADVQRKVCSEWQVPATWKPQQNLIYRGIYVMDDLATDDSGNPELIHFYHTKPERSGRAASASDAAAAGNAGAAAQPAGQASASAEASADVTASITQPPADATAVASAAAQADSRGNGALSVDTSSGAAAIAAQQNGGAAGDAAQAGAAAGNAAQNGAAAGNAAQTGATADQAANQSGAAAGAAAQPAASGDAAAQPAPAAKPDAAAPAADGAAHAADTSAAVASGSQHAAGDTHVATGHDAGNQHGADSGKHDADSGKHGADSDKHEGDGDRHGASGDSHNASGDKHDVGDKHDDGDDDDEDRDDETT